MRISDLNRSQVTLTQTTSTVSITSTKSDDDTEATPKKNDQFSYGTQDYSKLAGQNSFEQKYSNAVSTLGKYSGFLDQASGINHEDGLIGRSDLSAAMQSADAPAELKEACKFMLDNPMAFNRLETAQNGGLCDGLIGKGDIKAEINRTGGSSSSGNSAKSLGDVVSEFSSLLSKLQNMMNQSAGKSSGPTNNSSNSSLGDMQKLVDALKAMLANLKPGSTQSPKAGASGSSGIQQAISSLLSIMKNVMNQMSQMSQSSNKEQPSFEQQYGDAVKNLSKYSGFMDQAAGIGKKDGLIGKEDLQSVMNNADAPQELKDACKFLLNNSMAFNKLETSHHKGNTDGKIGMGDIESEMKDIDASDSGSSSPVQSKSSQSVPSQISKSIGSFEQQYGDAVKNLSKYSGFMDQAAGIGKKDGLIGKEDLQSVMNNADAPQELKDACKFLLNNPMAHKKLETSHHKGNADGKIGMGDIESEMKDINASGSGSSSPEQSKSSQSVPSKTSTLISSFTDLLSKMQSVFNEMQNATGSKQNNRAQDQSFNQKYSNAVNELLKNSGFLDQAAGIGKRDGLIGKEDLESVSNNPDASQELKDACKFLLNNPMAFNKLETSQHKGNTDGKIGIEDLETEKTRLMMESIKNSRQQASV